jgi:hypothetical protein
MEALLALALDNTYTPAHHFASLLHSGGYDCILCGSIQRAELTKHL